MKPTEPESKKVQKLKSHIFVCINERPQGHPRGCCHERNAPELIQRFKKELAKAGIASEVRAQKAGCLDTCEFGPSVVVYPDNTWYGRVTESDVAEIVQSHIVGGKPVQRLLIPGK